MLTNMQQKLKYDPLANLRKEVRSIITKKYKSVEEFCWENEIHKSTISRLLNGKRTEFQMATLVRIAEALGKKISVRLE
jgi:predicted XRE-type DNA-binding protein